MGLEDTLRAGNFNPKWGGYNSGKDAQPDVDIFLVSGKELDAPEWQHRMGLLQSWRQQARIQQSNNRMEMAIDEDFYDSIQFDVSDLSVLEERKQPVQTFNVLKETINWLRGIESKARVDYAIKPTKRNDADSAKAKTKLFKYDTEVNYGGFVMSRAFKRCVVAGVGWLDVGARNREDSPIYFRDESWRNVWYDHLNVALTQRSSRFVIREKWSDLDIATELFQDRKDELKTMSEHVNALFPYNPDDIVLSDPASEFDVEGQLDSMFSPRGETLRERVKLVECWYRLPAKVPILRMRDPSTPYGCLEGTIYRKKYPDQEYLINNGYFEVQEVLRMVVRCAFWCGNVYLKDMLSPYNHWEFPLVPMWCYLRERDNMCYGVVRDLRDPQIDLNKRRSKSLFLLSVNQIIAEEGAVANKEEAILEANRPDGYIETIPGKKFEIVRNIQMADAHLQIARDDERMIRGLAGNIDPELAQSHKEISGKFAQTVKQGTQISSGVLFESYYLAFQLLGEIRICLVEQFRDGQGEILDPDEEDKENPFLEYNKVLEDGTIKNPITKNKARFVVGKQDYRESIRIAMFETLSRLLETLSKAMPNVALSILDLVVDFMDDLPNKDEIVKRIRTINKQHSPDENLTPEEKQALRESEELERQKQNVIQQLQQAMVVAKLRVENAKATNSETKALLDKVNAAVKQLEGYEKALLVARSIQINPTVTEAADHLIAESRRITAGGTGRQVSPPPQGGNGAGQRQIGGGPGAMPGRFPG